MAEHKTINQQQKSCLYANKVFVLSSRGSKDLLMLVSHKIAVIKMLILKANYLVRIVNSSDCQSRHKSVLISRIKHHS